MADQGQVLFDQHAMATKKRPTDDNPARKSAQGFLTDASQTTNVGDLSSIPIILAEFDEPLDYCIVHLNLVHLNLGRDAIVKP